jgi:hypothetical protein
MSSRTAACGQPPVSIARMRDGERALWRVRNSASSLSSQSKFPLALVLHCAGGSRVGVVKATA